MNQILIIHPLWDVESRIGLFKDALDQLGPFVKTRDTFELSRRLWKNRRELLTADE